MSTTVQTATEIRPFHVDIPDEALDELRRRIAATRWPSRELVPDRSQGVQLATIQALASYWAADYEAQGRGEAQRLAPVHDRDRRGGYPLHPRQVAAGKRVAADHDPRLARLGHRVARDGRAADGPDRARRQRRGCLRSRAALPARVRALRRAGRDRLGPGRTARAWAELMRRLGYTRYVAQGGDVGAGVTDAMSRQAPEGLVGIHTNLLVPALSGTMPTDTDEERAAAAQIATFRQSGNGYFVEMATRPQTIGYALLDSPVALAAWMIDHDTDAYYKIARAFIDGQPSGNLTRDHILDNITLYWLTGTGASAARSYWEAYGPDAPAAGRQPLPPPAIPFGFTTFPGEIWRTPRSWVEASYPNVIYFHEVDKGGHFAAWEEPEILSSELREAFRSLRDRPASGAEVGLAEACRSAKHTHPSPAHSRTRERPERRAMNV